MHAINFACKSQFAFAWTCSSSCTWLGVIRCLICSMAAFIFWNWAQATAIKIVSRERKPQNRATFNNEVNHCEKVNRKTEFCHETRSFWHDDETNSSLNQCHCSNNIFVKKLCYIIFCLNNIRITLWLSCI